MIERGRNPGGRGVAVLASLRHSESHMARIVGLLIIRQVATRTGRRCTLEPSSDMASRACQGRMHARQSEAGEFQVIEIHVEPGVHVVTFLAGSRESGADVGGPGGLLEILRVAGVALGRHRGVVAQGPVLVARVAVQNRVCSHQGETVVVVLNRFDGYIPPVHAMALFAARSHLATMYISVALDALSPNVRKYRLNVALSAHHALVHSA